MLYFKTQRKDGPNFRTLKMLFTRVYIQSRFQIFEVWIIEVLLLYVQAKALFATKIVTVMYR